MSLNHLASSTDVVASQLNPNFGSLIVHGPTSLGAVTATSLVVPTVRPVISVAGGTASTTLTAAQSGSMVVVSQATANQTISLPTVAAGAGCTFDIYFLAAADGSHTTTVNYGGSALILGNIINQTSGTAMALVTCGGGKNNVIRSATALNTGTGDWLHFDCDGSFWWVRGTGAGAAATFTVS